MLPWRSILLTLLLMLHQQQSSSRILASLVSELSADVAEGSVIVRFQPSAGAAASAGRRLVDALHAGATTAAASAASGSELSWSVIDSSLATAVRSRGRLPAVGPRDVVAQEWSSSSSSSSSSNGIQAIVIRGVTKQHVKLIQQSDGVQAVLPDIQVRVPGGMAPANMDLLSISAERRCATAPQINSGVVSKTAPVASMGWPPGLASCGTGTYAAFIAQRCGSNFNLLEYRAVYAISIATQQVKVVRGRACVLFPQQTDQAKWFGSCGVAPTAAADLPTQYCSTFKSCARASTARAASTAGVAAVTAAAATQLTADASAVTADEPATQAAAAAAAAAAAPAQGTIRYTQHVSLKQPLKCGGGSTTTLTLIGNACGPGGAYVQWMRARAPGCAIVRDASRGGYLSTLALLGSCGAGPALAQQSVPTDVCTGGSQTPPPAPSPLPSASPSPKPSTPSGGSAQLARTSVADGEVAPRGVAMIEAVTSGGCAGRLCVADVDAVAAAQRVVVAVADSGVDQTHPDLNFVGGTSWLGADDQPGSDAYGHGTHVAGIVGAKNTGQGVVGVAPNIGIYSLKILDSRGNGVLSDAMRAIKWVISEGAAKNIKVINLSLAGHVDPTASYYKPMVDLFCGVCKEASDAGITIVAAAGNDGRNINEYIPAVCPTVITVTALDQDGKLGTDWSNYADASDAAAKTHTFAAPGTAIVSTVPRNVVNSGYLELGGTSMAAPHVAGIAANCIMSGYCNSTAADAMTKIREAARTRVQMTKGSNSTPWVSYTQSPTSSKWYGLLVWSRF